MSDRPFLRFWTGNWIGSSKRRLMSLEAQGAYILLLCRMWETPDCGLPDDDRILSRLAEAEMVWEKIKNEVRSCFFVENGRIYNEKLLSEMRHFKTQRENGSRGGRPKKNPNETQEKPKGTKNHNPNETMLEVRSKKLEVREDQDQPPCTPTEVYASAGNGKTIYTAAFEEFWKMYPGPRKKRKNVCWKLWREKKLDAKWASGEVKQGLEHCTKSMDWAKDNGRFIEAPEVWLRGDGWLNEMEPAKPKKGSNNGFY